MIRSVESWKKILAGCSAQQVASAIMGDLRGYSNNDKWTSHDEQQLANALQAVVGMTQVALIEKK